MLARSRDRTSDGRGFRVVGWACAWWYLIIVSGAPICIPGMMSASKDRSTPFPCMDSQCGCRDAEQCWKDCCCHTLSERIAWAREHGVAPPAYVVAADNQENWPDTRSCFAKKKSCCSNVDESESCGDHESSGDGIVLSQALKCKGVGGSWFSVALSLPPNPFRWSEQAQHFGWVRTIITAPTILSDPPPVPPPRAILA